MDDSISDDDLMTNDDLNESELDSYDDSFIPETSEPESNYNTSFDLNDSDSESDSESNSFSENLIQNISKRNKIMRTDYHDKNWIPEDIILTSKEKKHVITINQIQNMNDKVIFSPVELATITLNVEIPIRFNLPVIALYLQCDDRITGINCENTCIKGDMVNKQAIKMAKKKKKPKKGRKDRNDFYNQCTVNIKADENSTQIINIKLFPNGKMGLTGVKNINHAYDSIRYLLAKMEHVTGAVMYLTRSKEKGNIKNFRKKLIDANENLKWIQPEVDWDDFINSINIKEKQEIVYPGGMNLPPKVAYGLTFLTIMQTYLGDIKNMNEYQNDPFVIELYQNIKNSYVNNSELTIQHQQILDIYESDNCHPEKPILDEKSKGRFYLTLRSWISQNSMEMPQKSILSFFVRDDISISNINTKFSYNFDLSRSRLHKILSQKYKQKLCRFDENYGGVNLKYLCKVDCQIHNFDHNVDDDDEEENSECKCRRISILIFSNITLITGVRSYFQVMEGYDFITSVIRNELSKIIKLNNNQSVTTDKFPNVISSDKNVFIKKKHIINNPKNVFFLSKNKIIDKYDIPTN